MRWLGIFRANLLITVCRNLLFLDICEWTILSLNIFPFDFYITSGKYNICQFCSTHGVKWRQHQSVSIIINYYCSHGIRDFHKKKFNSIFTWLSFNGKKNTPIICFSATKTKILVSIFLLYKIIFLKSSMNSKWNAKFRWIYTKEDSTTCAFPPTNILSLSLSLLINYFFDKRKIHIYLVEGPFKQST